GYQGTYKRKEPVHKKDSVPTTKKGRRRRYPTESVVCRISVEIQEEITFMLGLIYPKTGMNQDELERLKRTLPLEYRHSLFIGISRVMPISA
ncbi:MAG: hypothetical protein IJX14_06820, partial [Clostridia bacterium]|nr:hypothetical protein [Clostridia bacterium]